MNQAPNIGRTELTAIEIPVTFAVHFGWSHDFDALCRQIKETVERETDQSWEWVSDILHQTYRLVRSYPASE